MIKKVLILFILFATHSFSQTKKSIDSINQIPYLELLKNHAKLQAVFKENAQNAKKINYQFGEATSYSNLSLTYYYSGNFEENLQFSLQAIKLFEKNRNKEALAKEYGELGYRMKERSLSKAIYYMQRGMKISEVNKFQQPLLSIYNNYGMLKNRIKEVDSALFYFRKCLALKERLKDSVGIPYSINNIAEVYVSQKRFIEAKKLFEKSLKIRIKLDDKYGIAENYSCLGDLFLAEKKFEKAIENYTISLELSKKYGFNTLLLHNYQMISQCYEFSNNASMALQSFKKHVFYKDSILNLETNEKIAELEVKFDTNEKEKLIITKENEVKNSRNKLIFVSILALFIALLGLLIYRQQKFKNKQLEQEFQLKNAIAKIETQNKLQKQRLSISRDLHDNIGAQLTFIISSIDNIKYAFPIKDLSLDNKLNKISDFTKATIVELRDTIWAMNSNEITFEDLHSRILNFIDKAQNATENVHFKFLINPNLDKIKLSSVMGMNLYRTIQEAINNSIKHSFAKNIAIEINSKANLTTIIISDDGIGFDENLISKGNGLLNMEKRIQEVEGSIQFGKNENGGTQIEIKLKHL
jgi:signal transduction histidine kinase